MISIEFNVVLQLRLTRVEVLRCSATPELVSLYIASSVTVELAAPLPFNEATILNTSEGVALTALLVEVLIASK